MADLTDLPSDLPVPQDDGAADHLVGRAAPELSLASTSGETVSLGSLPPGRTVLYLYPMTGRPDVDLPTGWDGIPGARGCTTQACDFRDHHQELLGAGASQVLGISSQDTDYQRELVDRLRLPFAMLSDPGLRLAELLELPTFEADSIRLYRRLTLVIRDGVIEHVFYPVFPPNEHAGQVLAWLRGRDSHADPRRQTWLASTWAYVADQLPPAPAQILEIGCGSEGGFVPSMLRAGYAAIGVDPMAPSGPTYRQLTFERLDLTRQVDAVVACTSLHHVADLDEALAKAAETLSPGGRLVLVELDWERFDEATARWCFDRLDEGSAETGHSWLRHLRDAWVESGQPWAAYLRGWATHEGPAHRRGDMLRAMDAHFERQ